MVSGNHPLMLDAFFFFFVRLASHVAGGIYWIWVTLRRSLHRPCIFGYTGHWRLRSKKACSMGKADVGIYDSFCGD